MYYHLLFPVKADTVETACCLVVSCNNGSGDCLPTDAYCDDDNWFSSDDCNGLPSSSCLHDESTNCRCAMLRRHRARFLSGRVL